MVKFTRLRRRMPKCDIFFVVVVVFIVVASWTLLMPMVQRSADEAPPWQEHVAVGNDVVDADNEKPISPSNMVDMNTNALHARAARGMMQQHTPKYQPVSLKLHLPEKYRKRPEFVSKEATFKRFGFDLRTSNKLPLDRTLPDYRSDACKAIKYPDPAIMPAVSVIIIFYNECLSTLLRNVISVLNNSPPELLGEVLLIDDNSTLDELSELPRHLAELQDQVPTGLIRLVHRKEHSGIVGARIRGAREAKHDIILFLDSHAETAPGWLTPVVARIHQDKKRVVIPNIRGFHLDTLELFGGDPWPPFKGSFNWRLSYVPIMADMEKDLVDPDHPGESPVRCPVMPGGLFAMDRALFFELGEYDPEIFYYGAEHVELSFRVWTCGATMEQIPCANVGHIYREFNRFSNEQDPLIKGVNIGRVLDRNDARVAKVSRLGVSVARVRCTPAHSQFREAWYLYTFFCHLSVNSGENTLMQDTAQRRNFNWSVYPQ
eukprot:m.867330 g.867330  ORF g.867330 m.867330 type:complete len:489 (+) comp23554_c5_seq14:170-1636(+)